MTIRRPPESEDTDSSERPDTSSDTVQVLVADSGNRRAIEGMLADHFEVDTSDAVSDADLHLVEDQVFSAYHDELSALVERRRPTFSPVVLIRRDTTRVASLDPGVESDAQPLQIDEVVDVPIDRSLLRRRLHSLLTLRSQSRTLMTQRDNLELLNQVVRHDIRNNLSVIKGHAEILEERTDEQCEESLSTLLRNAESAIALTNTARVLADVLLHPEGEAQTISLFRTLRQEVTDVREQYPQANLTVDGSVPETTVVADDMLSAVFRNLLQNAIKHNDKDVPEVSIAVREGDDAVDVRISDNGPGVDDAEKDDIFDRENKGLESGGSGIGLYLVKTLVERYDGAVWVEDNDPEGAVFAVSLPIDD
ncbi:MAG: sensor histidine kinase [Halobacteriota archaeon]